MAIYLGIRKRTAYLRGEDDYSVSTDNTVVNDHIQATVLDVLNQNPYSWNQTSATLTVVSGVADLPLDYNPKWGIYDARIDDDDVFTQIDPAKRELYSGNAYWITYDATTERYIFNSLVDGSVDIIYHFIPNEMVADGDVCVVPDGELIAYGAASKMLIGDERNVELKTNYYSEYSERTKKLYSDDLNFSAPVYEEY